MADDFGIPEISVSIVCLYSGEARVIVDSWAHNSFALVVLASKSGSSKQYSC